MATSTSLLVIGAGPYGLSVAALAREQGIDTVVTGRPMGFWRDHMPSGMFLRSGVDWHLDARGVHTLAAYLEQRGIAAGDVAPLPLEEFLEYTEWFRAAKGVEPGPELVAHLACQDGAFVATTTGGEAIIADAVVAAPGVSHFTHLPPWSGTVPEGLGSHTCDLVRFDELAGARVVVVGGRQSAYEWAALLAENGAERIDLVHRHEVPDFGLVSWQFVDPHVESTLRTRGWWRQLPQADRDAIALQFWQVGRLTLEQWLTPRLSTPRIHSRPGAEVLAVEPTATDRLLMRLSSGEQLEADRVIFATGYRADLTRVPYLQGVLGRIATVDGFPVLDEAFASTLPGLYLTGFSATRDFGPFFGFVKAAPAAATLIVEDLLRRA